MSVELRPHVPESQENILLNKQELRRSDPYIMQVSGLVIASDGVKRHSLLDVANTPFYGGSKILLKDKILNPNLLLTGGMPLVEPVIKAMFDSASVNDFVIVGNENQCEDLEEVASRNSNGKAYKVISNNGHIGEAVALGADNVSLSGYLFITMSDLPYANGQAVDFAVADILRGESIGADVYLPVASSDFFNRHRDGFGQVTFSRLQKDGEKGKYRGLNFTIANSRNVNPEAIKQYYDIRTIHGLKGKMNAARHFPTLLPEVALKYLASKLSMSRLEEMASELYGGEFRIVEVSDSSYVAFMKDIDTLRDYNAYRRKEMTPGR